MSYVGAKRDVRYVPPPAPEYGSSYTPAPPSVQNQWHDNIVPAHNQNNGGIDDMNYKEKGHEEHIEQVQTHQAYTPVKEPEEERPGFFGRLWRHFKRFWCFYFIAGIIFLAIMLPVFFLVIFPKVAQLLVNKADLPIYSAQILDPQPDEITYSLSAGLMVPKPFSVHLDPITLALFVDDDVGGKTRPYARLKLNYPDGADLKGNASIIIDRQTAKIENMTEFDRFLSSAVYNETFDLAAFGETDAHLGKLKASIRVDKRVKLNGLNMLKGFSINSARLLIIPDEDGTNLVANITLPNASLVTFDLGNETLNLLMGDLVVGQATIFDVRLVPGNNTVTARGKLEFGALFRNIPKVISLVIEPLSRGNIKLGATGNSTLWHGEHVLYFERVLNSLHIESEVPILGLVMNTLTGALGSFTAGGAGTGIAGLLSGLGNLNLGNGTGGVQNLTETISNINVSQITGLLGGLGGGSNGTGGGFDLSSIMGLVGQFLKKRDIVSLPITLPIGDIAPTVKRREAAPIALPEAAPAPVNSEAITMFGSALGAQFKGKSQAEVIAMAKEMVNKKEVWALGGQLLQNAEAVELYTKVTSNPALRILAGKFMGAVMPS